MARTLLTAAFLLSTLLHTARGVCKATNSLTAEEKAVLDAHNTLRAKHTNTDALCYGESGSDVTFTSENWSKQQASDKAMKHSTGGTYGENLAYAGTTQTVPARSAAYTTSTNAWYDEIQYWDYSTNAKKTSAPADKATGHFTQVVWRASKQVNCGYATYTDNSFNNYIVTCQYFPRGNFNNDYANQVGTLISTTDETCSKPTVASGTLQPTTATIKEGEKYTVTCAGGHTLVEAANTMTCGSDGKLTPSSLTCKADAKTCSKPTVASGTLQPTTATIKEGEKYTVTCAGGHTLVEAANTMTCGSDGKLTPSSLTCKADAKTCKKPTVASGTLQPTTATIKEGEKYTVTCAGGHTLVEAANTMTCGSDGNLTPSSLTCKADAKTCSKPTVENGSLNPTTATVKEGEKYTVTCGSGHILVGEVNTFTCGSDGKLSPASLTCKAEAKTCSKPTVVNGTVTPDSATVKEGEKYTVKCSEGFKLKGNHSTFTCGSDGKLTSTSTIGCEKDSGVGQITFSVLLLATVAFLLN